MLYFSETLDFLMGVQASMGRGQVFVGFGSAKNIFLKGKYQKNNLDLVNFWNYDIWKIFTIQGWTEWGRGDLILKFHNVFATNCFNST